MKFAIVVGSFVVLAGNAFAKDVATFHCKNAEGSYGFKLFVNTDGSVSTDSYIAIGLYQLSTSGDPTVFKGTVSGKKVNFARNSVLEVSDGMLSGATTGNVSEDGSPMTCTTP